MFFFKQKAAYEWRISDWSSDVCSSDLFAPDVSESPAAGALRTLQEVAGETLPEDSAELFAALLDKSQDELVRLLAVCVASTVDVVTPRASQHQPGAELAQAVGLDMAAWWKPTAEGYFRHIAKPAILERSEEHTSELQSLIRISYAVLCLNK